MVFDEFAGRQIGLRLSPILTRPANPPKSVLGHPTFFLDGKLDLDPVSLLFLFDSGPMAELSCSTWELAT